MSGLKVVIEGGDELIRELKRIGADVDAVLFVAIEAAGKVVQEAANPNAPSPHVELSRPKKVRGGVEISVGPDKEHWYHRFFETGAAAHPIKARDKKALLFTDRETYRRVVQHPGMPAQPFLRPALDENENAVRDGFGDKVKAAIKR